MVAPSLLHGDLEDNLGLNNFPFESGIFNGIELNLCFFGPESLQVLCNTILLQLHNSVTNRSIPSFNCFAVQSFRWPAFRRQFLDECIKYFSPIQQQKPLPAIGDLSLCELFPRHMKVDRISYQKNKPKRQADLRYTLTGNSDG